MPRDLHELAKLRDSLSYLYVDKAIVERDDNAIVILRKGERIPVPISSLTVLMLGPGTHLTHAAVCALADSGCMVVWYGEGALRFYGYGMGETRSAERLLRQARCCMDEALHIEVVRRMFALRFADMPMEGKTVSQLRGMEGVRVREAYKLYASRYGMRWHGRSYRQDDWDDADELNQALSAANACLYGLCNAAIVSLGYSPGLGFIHTGKMLSFVYDIADLYKLETSVPVAFEAVTGPRVDDLPRAVRVLMRRRLREARVLKRIADDLDALFDMHEQDDANRSDAGELWDPVSGTVAGGVNRAEDADDGDRDGERR